MVLGEELNPMKGNPRGCALPKKDLIAYCCAPVADFSPVVLAEVAGWVKKL
jgi:hypothetical protein